MARLLIGSHLNNSGVDMLKASAKEAIRLGETAFMIYLGAPQNTFRKQLAEFKMDEAIDILKDADIFKDHIIVHAAYIMNLASVESEKRNFSIDFIANELRLTAALGLKYMVLHPGNHLNQGSEIGVAKIADGIKEILEKTKDLDSVICLETMAGKGTEVGRTFEEIKAIMDKVNSYRVKVCLDTCHIHDAGYDIVNHYEEVINEFDRIIGLDNLKVIHLNDSKNECGSHKDRHENIGFGYIGYDTLHKICYDSRFEAIPKILETPWIKDENKNEYIPYLEEIEMIKSNQFNPELKTEIINKYNN